MHQIGEDRLLASELQELAERSEDRFANTDKLDIHCTVEWVVEDNTFTADAEIINVSRNGARISCPEPFAAGQEIRLTINAKEFDVESTGSAVVRWVEPCNANWMIGCEFRRPLSSELTGRLAVAGCVTRRQDIRRATDLYGQMSQELSGDQAVGVRIEDCSAGGVRIYSPRPAGLNERLLLRVRRASGKYQSVPIKVAWQIQIAAGYYIGCTFLDRSGCEAIEVATADAAERLEPADAQTNDGSTAWIWFAFGSVVTFFILRLSGL